MKKMDFNQTDRTWIRYIHANIKGRREQNVENHSAFLDYRRHSTQWIGSNYNKFWRKDIQDNTVSSRKYIFLKLKGC
jgi:hypothetical protein